MSVTKPAVRQIYQNHTLDSTRWDHYSPRPDDIVIATPFKSGTTWMQIIVMHLIFQDLALRPVWELSPWFENRWSSLDDLLNKVEGQSHRRFIKTHLPLDGLPYYEPVKYIVIGRDARDVFMSLWNFYGNFREETFEKMNAHSPDRPMPRRPEDIRVFWRQWISSGWFAWENEGYPFWSNMRHVQTWWDFKHLPNILFVHFNDLLGNLEGEISRIAGFLDIDVRPGFRAKIAEAVAFKTVKENAEQLGLKTDFFYKGTNARWHNVLTGEDLELYQAAMARELSPDCVNWLENGCHAIVRVPACISQLEDNNEMGCSVWKREASSIHCLSL